MLLLRRLRRRPSWLTRSSGREREGGNLRRDVTPVARSSGFLSLSPTEHDHLASDDHEQQVLRTSIQSRQLERERWRVVNPHPAQQIDASRQRADLHTTIVLPNVTILVRS